MNPKARAWIRTLELTPHPEGGYYAESYRAADTLSSACLPEHFGGERHLSTAIYFLLEGQQVSHLHRIASDELWHFYSGSALILTLLSPTGERRDVRIGSNPDAAERFQAVAPAGYWFGAQLADPQGYALVGCTVAPGFHFDDFELADRSALLEQYPQHADIIRKLTPA